MTPTQMDKYSYVYIVQKVSVDISYIWYKASVMQIPTIYLLQFGDLEIFG